ncbi:MAG TPA: cysteine desulfurase family protein [Kofleriaceae bacterium]|nr:cysteine desulfurase family protein [Kofleriaceae bacterium]
MTRPLQPHRTYLDYNATTPLAPEVRGVMLEVLDSAQGNPSSIHAEGRTAREWLERARRQVAALLSARPDDVIFTSGGTEADALGAIGLYAAATAAGRPPRVLVATIEHPAVHGAARALAARGAEIVELAVDPRGRLELDSLERALAAGGAALVAIALANHELGTAQDLPAVARLAAAAGALVHCDAVQAAGRIDVDVAALGADAVAISGHKIYGPKGVGALWIRPGLDLAPLWSGGHQERERRPGTENVAGIAGLGAAAELAAGPAALAARARIAELAGELERGVLAIDGARVHGAGAPRVPGTVNAGFAGAPGELVTQALDLAGVAVSTGAACTSGSVSASPVLLALGLPRERALEGVRFSLGRPSSRADIQVLLELLPGIVSRVRTFA